MKKLLSLFLAVMLLFTTLTITSFAADTAIVTVEGADGEVGDVVSLKVKLNTSGPVNVISFKSFEFNDEVLEFTGFADYSYLSDNKALPEIIETSPSIAAAFGLKDPVVFDSSNEDIISLEFKVLKEQKTEVSFVTVVKNDSKKYDVTITPAEVNASAGGSSSGGSSSGGSSTGGSSGGSSSGGSSGGGSSSGGTTVKPSSGSSGSGKDNTIIDLNVDKDTAILGSTELENKETVNVYFKDVSASVSADIKEKEVKDLSVSLKETEIELGEKTAENALGKPLGVTVEAKDANGAELDLSIDLAIASEKIAYAYIVDEIGNATRCESVYNEEKAQVEIKAVKDNTVIVILDKVPESFADVDGRWSQVEIEKANDRGLVNGKSKDVFEPAGNLTRHESNKLHMNFANAVKAELAKDSAKTVDTANEHWAYESDLWAVAVGISNGTAHLDDGTVVVSGGNNITRQDYMTSIYRMMKLVLGDIQTDGESIEFADSADIADYAKDAISCLSSLDIVKGSETSLGLTVSPVAQITREEAVAILNRVYDAILALN